MSLPEPGRENFSSAEDASACSIFFDACWPLHRYIFKLHEQYPYLPSDLNET
jgi:hypothetical protein